MRTDTPEFMFEDRAVNRRPIIVIAISFDNANTDIHYLTSKPVSGLTGNIINNTLEMVSTTSQKIDYFNARSTIGDIEFRCQDIGLTTLQRTKLIAGDGLNGKRVQVYKGYEGLLWANFQLVQTQIISKQVQYKDGFYTFQCSDIQRAMRRDIFEPRETTLTASFSETETTSMSVLDTTGFEVVYQVPSAQGLTLLRGLQDLGNNPELTGVNHIGLLKLEVGGEFEIILWQNKTAFSFQDLTRGVLGTKPLAFDLSDGANDQNAPKVTEYIYMEMPAIKAAYAILTGALYGHPGETLPDHWHLGISTNYVSTSAFTSIGDIWDTSDDDNGMPIVIRDPGKEDGKKFIEQGIYYMCGVYSPILSTGELGLKKHEYIGPAVASSVAELTPANIVSYSKLNHELGMVANRYTLRWNYDERQGKFTRVSRLESTDSSDVHQISAVKEVELKTLHGSRHSDKAVKNYFDTLRTRFAGPPLTLQLTLTPDMNGLEVGDIVRVRLPYVEDYSNSDTGPLNRNFEIQSIKNDWVNGLVTVDLFASSRRPEQKAPEFTDGIDSAFVSAVGVELSAANLGAGNPLGDQPSATITSSGGTTTITGTLNLTGHADLGNSACVYYCDEDLVLAAGATINITLNVQIRVNGFFQINGAIDGTGAGYAGGSASGSYAEIVSPSTAQWGTRGVGFTQSGGGWHRATSTRTWGRDDQFTDTYTEYTQAVGSHNNRAVLGHYYGAPEPEMEVDDSYNIIGLPLTLCGTSAASGGGIGNSNNSTVVVNGGAGGASGAGLAIFSRGAALAPAATIDLSGSDGSPGLHDASFSFNNYAFDPAVHRIYSGAGGGGAPGALMFVTLDSSQSYPDIAALGSQVTMNHGLCPEERIGYHTISVGPGGAGSQTLYRYGPNPEGYTDANLGLPASSSERGGGTAKEVEDAWEQNISVVFLDTRSSARNDDPPFVSTNPTFTLTEYRNTPATAEGNRSTIEVSITPPPDANYHHSVVEYRQQGETGWTRWGAAAPEALIEVPSTGLTYEVRVLAVSNDQNVSPSGTIQTITVTDIDGRTDGELAALYPFDAITVTLDSASFRGDGVGFTWGDDNRDYSYFAYYRVEIHEATDGLLRAWNVTDPQYVYDLRANAEDYLAQNGTDGAYAQVEIRVYPVAVFRNGSGEYYKGTYGSLTANAATTVAPIPTLSFTEVGEALLSWPETNNEYYTTTYLLEYDSEIITQTTDNQMIIPVSWVGSRTFTFYSSVISGQLSAGVSVSISPAAPGQPTVTQRVIDNNVLFNYESAKGSLPIERYEIRKGATYNVGNTPIATKAGTSTFTVIAETVSGTFTYWFDAIDIAGNRSATRQISAIVNEPPDFNFVDSYSAEENNWPGTLTNCIVDINNRLILPVNNTETYAEHFTNNSWDQPQDQIDAGYEYFLQPSTSTASYQFEWDTGAVIASTMITVSPAPTTLDGSVTHSTEIEYRETTGDSWTSGGAGIEQVLATDFRYVRVTVSFTASGGDDLAYLNDLIVRLDAKIARDSGKGTVVAGGPTTFTFNKNFVDAEPPRVSINSSTPYIATVDYVDAANPTDFDVYIFSTSGTTASADIDISWETAGFLGS